MSITQTNPAAGMLPSLQLMDFSDEGHVVQLYTGDEFLIETVSRFIGRRLATGETAIVVATKAHQQGIDSQLKAWGLDTKKALAQGRYLRLDAGETLAKLLVNGVVSEARFNEVLGGILARLRQGRGQGEGRLAIFGEMVALLWAEGKPDEAVRLEQLWNKAAQSHAFSLLCAYPAAGFADETHSEQFLKMCAEHSVILPTEKYMGLSGEKERLRNVAQLEQRARVLEKKLATAANAAQFRLLVEEVQDYAIFMLDPSGCVSTWNKGAERIKGYKASDIIGKHFSCFYPEEDLREGKPAFELILAARDGRIEDEGWRVRKDGSKFWANVVITAVRDETGQLRGFAKVTRDFTERMETRNALQKEVSEKRETERRLQDSENSLRKLALHLLRTQDEERRRVGRDLHDSLGQLLAMLKINLECMTTDPGSRTAEQRDQCASLAAECLKEVRTISYLLYPPMLEELGLSSTLNWYLEGFSKRSSVQTSLEVGEDIGRHSRDVELVLFRVLQESLTNIHRHSGSRTAHVRLHRVENDLRLEVRDTGKGVSFGALEEVGQDWIGAMGVGLRGMNERVRQLGGRLEIASSEKGTLITAVVPAEKPVLQKS